MKTTLPICFCHTKLDETELENCRLRDPLSRENRLCHLNQSRNTVGTSGHFLNYSTNTSLLASVRILREEDFDD